MSNPENNSINTKITQLNEKVQWFYSDDFKLEKAVDKYKEATKLAKTIEEEVPKEPGE